MTDIPTIKTMVTYMEMVTNPLLPDIALDGYELKIERDVDVHFYLDLYREIGRDYIWNYRPGQTVDEVGEIIQSDRTRLYVLYDKGAAMGMAEIDLTDKSSPEIVHFGLLPAYIDKGLGRSFLHKIIYLLWQGGIDRLWLSTCDLDHPKAIAFYQNAGFKVFKTKEAIFKDWRYTGFYNMTDAPQIPLAD
jgi:GNAT superfamily N-acetyltransferase